MSQSYPLYITLQCNLIVTCDIVTVKSLLSTVSSGQARGAEHPGPLHGPQHHGGHLSTHPPHLHRYSGITLPPGFVCQLTRVGIHSCQFAKNIKIFARGYFYLCLPNGFWKSKERRAQYIEYKIQYKKLVGLGGGFAWFPKLTWFRQFLKVCKRWQQMRQRTNIEIFAWQLCRALGNKSDPRLEKLEKMHGLDPRSTFENCEYQEIYPLDGPYVLGEYENFPGL